MLATVTTTISLLTVLSCVESYLLQPDVVSQDCMQCLCNISSWCTFKGCTNVTGFIACGYYQISQDYYVDCGSPGSDWKTCADDLNCATYCVQSYMRRYRNQPHCHYNCLSYAMLHKGGPSACGHVDSSNYLAHFWGLMAKAGCHENS
ncbi:hypothetical protein ScPMuIL_001486 [Solemya velum]